MITINIGSDDKKFEFHPIKAVQRKIDRWHNNPGELGVDVIIVTAAGMTLERVGYFINSVTRAAKARQ